MDLAVCHEQQMTPADIVSIYPSLTAAEVSTALDYYFDHREEIQQSVREELRYVEEARKCTISILDSRLQAGEE